jgi:two-component system, chemotaxis family, protein-glutamate methylesterase/glutaminase
LSDPTRVLIVEDSRIQRRVLSTFLSSCPGIEVVGEAQDGTEGVKAVNALRPNVVLMDVRMPNLDGLQATQQIMGEAPTPILLMTTPDNLASEVDLGLRALEAGALDLIKKPSMERLSEDGPALAAKLRLLAGVPVISHVRGARSRRDRLERNQRSTGYFRRASRVVGIATSTGGPRALQEVLSSLPERLKAAVVIVQHLDVAFMDGFVRWLDEHCPLPVHLAKDKDELLQGVVYVCPTGLYAEVNGRRRMDLSKEEIPRGGHCPSGDRLLASLAKVYGSRGVGVVMTGMGEDGAAGLLAMRKAGAFTIAQDEESSVLFGMPKEAAANGAATHVLPLGEIAATISGAVAKAAPGAADA